MKKLVLENLNKIIEERLKLLKEDDGQMPADLDVEKDSQKESIYDAKPGNTLIIDFENVTNMCYAMKRC